jgi:hypothetical protein
MCKATPPSIASDVHDVHLVVLQHGLWGKPVHVEHMEKLLMEHCQRRAGTESSPSKREVRSLNSDVNQDKTTYDGIDNSG